MRRVRPTTRRRQLARPLLVALVATCLLSGIAGGLMRAGVPLPGLGGSAWVAQATGWHAALMIGGFLGTVIGIERAVAVRTLWAFAAPLASALGGLCLLVGQALAGAWLLEAAAAVFVAVNVLIVTRQRATHTGLLLLAAGLWLGGNTLLLLQGLAYATLAAWFGFLILTIAAERLEMSRLMRRQPRAQFLLLAVVALLLASVGLAPWQPLTGGVGFGASLLLLALWLAAFDVARLTVQAHGLSRYMAISLLGGYAWLALGGLCWAAHAAGWPNRDAALHALGLGFIMSMVMAHAPVILPAVAGIKLHFDARFYLPLLLLQLSLLARLLPGAFDPTWRAIGSAGNALAIALFALTVISAAGSWRRRHAVARPTEARPSEGRLSP